MKLAFPASLLAALCAASLGLAAPFDEMDYGPFISATYTAPTPKDNLTHRGIAVRFSAAVEGEEPVELKQGKKTVKSEPAQCGVIFDTELCRYSAGWSGGFINFTGVVFDGGHGANPSPRGTLAFATAAGPGWARDG